MRDAPPHDRLRTDWFAVLVLFGAGLVASMHFAKLAPVMDAVRADLALSLPIGGFAVSVVGVVGILFAIAAGALAGSIGLARSLSAALFGGAVVALAGAAAPEMTSFLLSRVAEGFSHLMIVVAAPALMSAHAAPRDRPMVLSLWGCFFGLGYAITSAAAPAIVAAGGWRALLAAHAVALAAVGILVAVALRRSGHRDQRGPAPRAARLVEAHARLFRSGAPLRLALAFGSYTLLFLAILTFLPRFLRETFGWSEAAAGSYMALASLGSLVFTLLAGYLSRLGVTLFAGMAGAFALVAATSALIFLASPPAIVAALAGLAMMAGFGALPGFVFANVPRIAPDTGSATLAYGAIALFGNVGTFSGTPLFAIAYEALGWPGGAAFVCLVAAAGISLAASVAPLYPRRGAAAPQDCVR
jgi:predicted MFS family arabinose efflux permease